MKQVVGGSIAVILGLFGLSVFFPQFLSFLAGIVPVTLLAGGGLIVYLKCEEGALDFRKPADKEPMESKIITTEPAKTKLDTVAPLKGESVKIEPVEEEPAENIPDKVIDDNFGLRGNKSSHVFHNQDCKYSKSKQCTMVFSSRDKAIADGYKPCKTCKP